jgi:NAD(P)-dependent dehydrogenase (short-subunit alcohol dehydrogenase family)
MSTSKVWFITGASSGFGRSLAEEVIVRGERVIAAARNVGALKELVALAPERVRALRLDVTKADEIARAIAEAGDIDVLVNNAGFSMIGALEETSEEALREAMETMFFGAVALTRAALPRMRARKTGTIVQVSSMGGLTTAPGFGPYCAAKHALEGLSECLAKEVAPFGIKVLIVEPGAFRTSLFGAGFKTMPALDVYAPTVGPTRDYVTSSHNAQAGDPVKAARAILTAVDAASPTLRLPLGADAVDGIRAKIAELMADVDANEAAARATAY